MSKNKREVKYNEEFDQHFEDIYDYLKEQSPQIAKEFAQELKVTLIKIEKSPTANSIEPAFNSKYKWFRFALVKKKWKIIFKVTTRLLIFMGIINTSRHPNEIKKLIKNGRKT